MFSQNCVAQISEAFLALPFGRAVAKAAMQPGESKRESDETFASAVGASTIGAAELPDAEDFVPGATTEQTAVALLIFCSAIGASAIGAAEVFAVGATAEQTAVAFGTWYRKGSGRYGSMWIFSKP